MKSIKQHINEAKKTDFEKIENLGESWIKEWGIAFSGNILAKDDSWRVETIFNHIRLACLYFIKFYTFHNCVGLNCRRRELKGAGGGIILKLPLFVLLNILKLHPPPLPAIPR